MASFPGLTLLTILSALHNCASDILELNASVTWSGRPSLTSKSLFGYSVGAFSHSGQFYVIVGDPAAFNSATNTTSGSVFICPVSQKDFKSSGSFCSSTIAFSPSLTDPNRLLNYMKIGHSLSTLSTGEFSICAPGYAFTNSFNSTVFPGLCGVWSSPKSPPVWVEKFFPFQPTSDEIFDFDIFGKCLGGFASKLFRRNGQTVFSASGPFCRVSLGVATFSINFNASSSSLLTRSEVSDLDEMQSYVGYAMDVDAKDSSIIYSSPILSLRDKQVFITTDSFSKNTRLYKSSSDFFERNMNYIGYSLATLTFRGKSYVILGAPHHSDVSRGLVNSGCVFIFPSQDANKFRSFCSQETYGLFGLSLLNIGDINYDDNDDFAVGCPWCGPNKTGSLYFFLGSTAEPLEPFQIISSDLVSQDLRGFGWALAGDVDIDNNGASEIIATSVLSNHVSIIPTKLLLVGTAALFDGGLQDLGKFKRKYNIDELLNDVLLSEAGQRHSLKISLALKKGFKIDSYDFDVLVRLDEDFDRPDAQRFLINITSLSRYELKPFNGLYLLKEEDVVLHELRFQPVEFDIQLKPTAQRKISISEMFRDIKLKLYIKILPKKVKSGTVPIFPSVLINGMLLKKYEGSVLLDLYQFKPLVCSFGCSLSKNIGLELLNSSVIIVDRRQITTIALRVYKDPGSFYGGVTLKAFPGAGLYILDNVMIGNESVKLWQDWHDNHADIILSEPFGTAPDVFTDQRAASFVLTFQVNFDGSRSEFPLRFVLEPMYGEGSPWEKFVQQDNKLSDNVASLSIKINSSLILNVVSMTPLGFTIADYRESAVLKDPRDLSLSKHAISVKDVGPLLNHTYHISSVTRPVQPFSGLSVNITMPFMSWNDELLVLFPSEYVVSSDGTIRRFNGLPFIADNPDSTEGTPCQLARDKDYDRFSKYLNQGVLVLDKYLKTSNRSKRDLYLVETSRKYETSTGVVTYELAATPGKKSDEQQEMDTTVSAFDCDRIFSGPFFFKCITFTCPIRTLNTDDRSLDGVYVNIFARMWSQTFFANHIKQFTFKTSVLLISPQSSAFLSLSVNDNSTFEQLYIFPNMKIPFVVRIPWHLIILAIFLGIILLLLLILLLWYLNFFKRRRFQYNKVPIQEKNTFEGDEFYQ